MEEVPKHRPAPGGQGVRAGLSYTRQQAFRSVTQDQ
jgi:hypothetical protein